MVSGKKRESLFTLQIKLPLDTLVGDIQNHKISLSQHDFYDFPGTALHSLNPWVKFEGEGGRGETHHPNKEKDLFPKGHLQGTND